MTYKTKNGKEYMPNRRLLVCVNNDGSYDLLLKHNTRITYLNRDSFEHSLEKGTNKFFCKICKDYDFLSNLLGSK